MKLIISVIITSALLGHGATRVGVGSESYPAFWSHFKTAIANKDMRAIKKMTHFPFVVGFQDDQDHQRYVDASHFSKYFQTEMNCRDGGMALTDIILEEKVPQRPHDGTVGVYDYEFRYVSSEWRFVGTNYADSGELTARLHGRCDH